MELTETLFITLAFSLTAAAITCLIAHLIFKVKLRWAVPTGVAIGITLAKAIEQYSSTENSSLVIILTISISVLLTQLIAKLLSIKAKSGTTRRT